MIAGVDYTLKPMEAIEEQVSLILKSLETDPLLQESTINEGGEKQPKFMSSHEEKEDTNLAPPTEVNVQDSAKVQVTEKPLKHSGNLHVTVYIIVILCIILGIAGVLLAKTKRSRQ